MKRTSVVALPSDYVCIDLETTGLEFEFDDIIEMSAARVSNGEIIEVFSELVNPGRPVGSFITDLTGITDDMLSGACDISDVLPRFLAFCGDRILVGHNAYFDMRFVSSAADLLGLSFTNDYIDTLRIARKVFPEKSHHRLFEVSEYCGVTISTAHRAEADVRTTVACFEAMKKRILSDMTESDFVASFKRHRISYSVVIKGVVPKTDEFDETHPLFGKYVVFTGALSRMTRLAASQLVADVGGIPLDTVSSKTNFLVIGNEEFVSSVKNGKTRKMQKADELRQKGCDIVTLSENQFFDMLDSFEVRL